MQPCLAWIWPADSAGPVEKRVELQAELALDRELFGVTDSSISRTAHAPRIYSLSSNRVQLRVPERSALGVVVVHGVNFGSMQRDVPPLGAAYRVSPAALGRRSRAVFGPRSCLGLFDAVDPRSGEPTHHLISLPRAERVDPGSEQIVAAPAILMVGMNAACVLAGATVSPESAALALPKPQSFQLPQCGVSFAGARELDAFLPATGLTLLRIAGHDEHFFPAQLPQVARAVLTRLQTHYAYVPVLMDDREPRLALLYERQDGSVGAQISDANVAQWLEDIAAALSEAELRASSRPPSGGKVVRARPTQSRDLAANGTLPDAVGFGGVLTHSSRFAEVLEQVHKVADSDLGLLLLGPSGTGKEHLARAVHAASRRAAGPFIAINCGAIPEALIESELFGHHKGAFTGTQGNRAGAFAAAEGGTLLLDEIADAPLRVQLALLRALETRSIKPVGADRERAVDVRVFAATSRNLPELIVAGHFREDLYFRLAELPVTLPPLRERAADLALIVGALLEAAGCTKPLTFEAMAELRRHTWPGNIRELRNVLRRAVLLSDGSDSLEAKHFAGLSAPPWAAATLEPRPTPPIETVPVDAVPADTALEVRFPDSVRAVADQLWAECALPPLPELSRYERRASGRAALLYLAQLHGRQRFPTALMALWTQLFGERWATSEEERGLKDLLKTLGYSPHDERVREWVQRAMRW